MRNLKSLCFGATIAQAASFAVVAGKKSIDEGLAAAQASTQRAIRQAGYPKK